MRERVLVEDGEVASEIAASMFTGTYHRGERVIVGGVYLTPTQDGATTFSVKHRRTEETVETINLDAVSTASALVGLLREIDADREGDTP